MPRLTERNPSYRKHRATGQAVVTIGGRDFYLGPWGTCFDLNGFAVCLQASGKPVTPIPLLMPTIPLLMRTPAPAKYIFTMAGSVAPSVVRLAYSLPTGIIPVRLVTVGGQKLFGFIAGSSPPSGDGTWDAWGANGNQLSA